MKTSTVALIVVVTLILTSGHLPANTAGLHHEEARQNLNAVWNGSQFELKLQGDTYWVQHLEHSALNAGRRLWTFTVRKKRGAGLFNGLKEDWKAEVQMTYVDRTGELEKCRVSVDTGETVAVEGLVRRSVKIGGGPVEAGVEIDVLGTLQAASKVFHGTGEKQQFATSLEHIIHRMHRAIH